MWTIKSAFGPSYKTVSIDLGSGKTLVGEETYNADFAAVFYDVDLKLVTQELDTFKLGRATFHDENWHKSLRLDTVGNWFALPVKESSYSKLLLANRTNKMHQDTTFSPLELRYDSLWRAKHDDIPVYLYTGTSTIDSIRMNNIFVTYDYRIGYSEPFTFFVQSVEYLLDPISGRVKTKKVFERKEK
ncbi:hypothetical protein SAMN05421545_3962 [Pontibacter lucknowensis]|uniref:Uncharacterized protein n=2 Tax=Pontibacter lucknowensis TaxID=1077936 RepID=A0A1N7BGW5_9BACT|nr:hypothetical protein SAMN05421545_3962 [Pontibacter lucknowensis]